MLYKNHAKWQELYEKLAGPDWPPCPLEVDMINLPKWVQKELYDFGYKHITDFPNRFISPGGKKNINIFYLQSHDGGGTGPGQDYITVLRERYPDRVFNKVYEWCAGPGFIGYSILDHGIAENLCLSDIYDPALQCADETRNYPSNNVQDKVSIYLMRDLELMPDQEQFDLVVANPPHINVYEVIETVNDNCNRITTDLNWESHKNFFKHIGNHLTEDGIVLIQQNHAGSTLETFLPMIEESGLEVTDHFLSKDWYEADKDHTDPSTWPVNKLYYIELKHKK
jgi:hypothetical protein